MIKRNAEEKILTMKDNLERHKRTHEQRRMRYIAQVLGISPRLFLSRPDPDFFPRYRTESFCFFRQSSAEMNKTTDTDLIREKTRLTKALADARELKNKILKGEYVKVKDAQKAYDKIAGNIRTKLLALPESLAPQLQGLSQTGIESLLRDKIY